MGKAIYIAIIWILIGHFAFAQSLVPATSEDLSEFDRQISAAQRSSANSTGKSISEESKKKKMSQLADDFKKNEDKQGPSSAKDAKVSAPKYNDRGNSSNAPGRGSKNGK